MCPLPIFRIPKEVSNPVLVQISGSRFRIADVSETRGMERVMNGDGSKRTARGITDIDGQPMTFRIFRHKNILRLRDLSCKMSPPNPKRGSGPYQQSADIAYYRLLDALVTGSSGRRVNAILSFQRFETTLNAFLAHVRRRLDQLHAKPKKYGIRTRGAAPQIQQRRKETK